MTDPYEQQLLAVFESCDVKGTGRLDCDGLTQLCDQLHLEDGRHQLMDCLLPAFTFDQFRDALLTLLGATRRHREPSPEREVSPKFVFGQKKYGRRSRPESTGQEGDEDDEEVDDYEDEDCDTFLPSDQIDNLKSKTSASILIDDCHSHTDADSTTSIQSIVLDKEELGGEAELRAARRQLAVAVDGYLDRSELALVCRAVGMEKMADEVVKQVFAKLDVDTDGRISFEEFLQLFHGSHTPHAPSSFQQHTSLDITSSGFVSSDSLVDLWEAGGVVNASSLLLDLGVNNSSEVSLTSLAAMLDEELRSMASKSVSNSPQVNALTAALVLAQAQLKWTRCCLEQMTGERDKLHSDLAEANQRASLLAAEVDDRHARMERASQMQIKLLEQRHAEQVKQLSVQLAMDRDQLTAATLRLEKRLALQQEEESKLRADLHAVRAECEVMEKENQILSEQLAACDQLRSRADRDSSQLQQLQQRVQELEGSSEQVQTLVEQLARLTAENTGLRDRNDELTIQVENLSARPICKRQNSSEGSVGTKRRGDSPLLRPEHCWDEESPRLGKVRRYNDLSPDSVPIEGLAIGRSLRHSESGLEADLDTLDNSLTPSSPSMEKEAYLTEIRQLRSTLAELQQANEEYKKKLVSATKAVENEECSGSYAATESTEVQTSLNDGEAVDRLEKHCHHLQHTLEHVQTEILKILSEKKACNEENCVLKQRIEDLSKQLPKTLNEDTCNLENSSGPLTYTVTDVPNNSTAIGHLEPLLSDHPKDSPQNIALKCFPFMNRKQSDPDSSYCLFPKKDNEGFKFENLSQFAFELSQSLSNSNFIDDPFSDLGCKPLSPCLSENDVNANCKLESNKSKCDDSIVIVSKSDFVKENMELKEKCAELETSLELMRVEYEKCEDYWQGKLNEERAIFDQEQKLSDDKFSELEAKIQEYAELFKADDKKTCGRLPTIDERDSLEKQVTDLEDEFEEFRKSAERESIEKSEQIDNMQVELKELRKKLNSRKEETSDVGVQAPEQSAEFRLHDPQSSTHSKVNECCCPCHTASRKSLMRLRDRLQAECDMLHRRRELMLHQLTQLHQRTSLLYSHTPDRRLASDVEMFHNLSSRLRHQELRCRHLQSALKHHQRQTDKLLQSAWEQHRADLTTLQKTLHSTQEKLLHQSKICKQQLERLAASDVLVKDLYKENAHLTALVQKLEEQNLFVDQSIFASAV